MSAKWVVRGGIGLLVAALVAGVIVYASDSPDPGSPDRHPITDPVPPRVTELMMRFEEASGTLADDYRNEKVSAAEWLQSSSDHLPVMVSALSIMGSRLTQLRGREPSDLRKYVRLSRDELEALFELRGALAGLDAVSETYAWDHWARARHRQFRFLSDYLYRRHGASIDFRSILPSIPLKSLA